MKQRILESYVWDCPACGLPNVENVLEIDGPFVTCTCEHCGRGFDRDKVTVTASSVPA